MAKERSIDKAKAAAIWAGVALVGVAGIYVVGTYTAEKIKEVQASNAENATGTQGSASSFAARLLAAMDGPGTDEEIVLAVLREIPSAAVYIDVITAYARLSGGQNLNAVLRDELTSFYGNEDYEAALSILHSKR